MNRILKGWTRKGFLIWVLILGFNITGSLAAKAEMKPSLAILPFFVKRLESPTRGAVLCPLCKGVYRSGEVVAGSDLLLTHLAYQKFETLERFSLLPLDRTEEAFSPSVKKEFEKKPIPSGLQIGEELNADYVLMGFLFRFEERVGSSLGVEKPASVGYDLHLLRVRDGKIVWTGKFDETQRPLSENLFKIGTFLRTKGKWLSAVEFANVGMDEMLKKFPGTKELEETP
jgi:hypothetical protein